MKTTKILLILLLIPQVIFSQERVNTPDLVINEEPLGELEEEISGWTYSLDGKWIEGEQRVYERLLSVQTEKLESPPYALGVDNFEKLSTYEMYYGTDTLLLLVKSFEDGYYRYPRSKSGWEDQRSVHYFVIDQPRYGGIDSLDSDFHSFAFRLRASGTIRDVSKRRTISRIMQGINMEQSSHRYLYIDAQAYVEESIIRFMVYSNHEIFHDLKGTVGDLTMNGKSLFGTPQLLNYIYFEANLDAFGQLQIL